MQEWAGGQGKEDKYHVLRPVGGYLTFLNLQFIHFKGKGDRGQQVSR